MTRSPSRHARVRIGAAAVCVAGATLALTACGGGSVKQALPSISSSSPVSGIQHPCVDATLDVPRGRQIDLGSCGADASVSVTDPANALSRLGSLVFIARGSGQATIDVTRGPVCTPGQQCSGVRQQVARIVVNVS